MVKRKVIQVFEYDKLRADRAGDFKPEHFDRLVRYNEANGNCYFKVGHNTIYFESYVGVIQVDNLIIEILPKADKNGEENKNKWHVALIRFLQVCRKLRLESLTDAQLKLRSTNLLDLYFLSYLEEVENLVHMGLFKQYRKQQGNVGSLKGRLMFQKQISKNLVHQERFYTEHSIYDRNHQVNRILKKGLEVLVSAGARNGIVARAKRLLLNFDSIETCAPELKDFNQIPTTRKTAPYTKALLLAKMIILNYSPDVKGGQEHILALLFKMERLFEEYVTIALRRAAQECTTHTIRIEAQASRDFWQSQTIRPDIVATIKEKGSEKERKVIIDAKWKVLKYLSPSGADLKQMFAYNLHFNSMESVLLYPKVYFETTDKLSFHEARAAQGFSHHCQLYFAELVDEEGMLRADFGTVFVKKVLEGG